MTIQKNYRKRVAVGATFGKFSASITQSFRKAKRGSRLTLQTPAGSIKLNGHQINTLRKVLDTAAKLASK